MQDLELEFNFLKISAAVNNAALLRAQEQNATSNLYSPIEFSVVPNTFKVSAGSVPLILILNAKLRNSYMMNETSEDPHTLKRTHSMVEETMG